MRDDWKEEMGLVPKKKETNGNDLSTAFNNVEVNITA
jgi:hypothetical protein